MNYNDIYQSSKSSTYGLLKSCFRVGVIHSSVYFVKIKFEYVHNSIYHHFCPLEMLGFICGHRWLSNLVRVILDRV